MKPKQEQDETLRFAAMKLPFAAAKWFSAANIPFALVKEALIRRQPLGSLRGRSLHCGEERWARTRNNDF